MFRKFTHLLGYYSHIEDLEMRLLNAEKLLRLVCVPDLHPIFIFI